MRYGCLTGTACGGDFATYDPTLGIVAPSATGRPNSFAGVTPADNLLLTGANVT